MIERPSVNGMHETSLSHLAMARLRATGWAVGALLAMAVVACGGKSESAGDGSSAGEGSGTATAGELTAFEVENGIGPVTEVVELGELDPALASAGEEVFVVKCSACHKISERYVGPALGGVTERRSPTYIMNMILNPKEMYERHPEAKALLAEYLTFMPNQDVSVDDARAIVEYLRSNASSGQE